MSNLLIVDDDADSIRPLAMFLERVGHTVACAENGKRALADIFHRTPDVVVLDLLMPEMDGASLLEVVRLYLRFQNLPVVVLTGVPDGPLAERVWRAGASSILVKGKATFHDIGAAVRDAAGPPVH